MSNKQHHETLSIIGKAPWCMLYCASCVPTILPGPSHLKQHSTYAWAVIMHCPKCSSGWVVCKLCRNSRKPLPLGNVRMLEKHGKHYHPTKSNDGSYFQREKMSLTTSAAAMDNSCNEHFDESTGFQHDNSPPDAADEDINMHSVMLSPTVDKLYSYSMNPTTFAVNKVSYNRNYFKHQTRIS